MAIVGRDNVWLGNSGRRINFDGSLGSDTIADDGELEEESRSRGTRSTTPLRNGCCYLFPALHSFPSTNKLSRERLQTLQSWKASNTNSDHHWVESTSYLISTF
mmetsp:Transcript_14085/g.34122  ORF Transcript_14085/g.34122 Transcript_14085/m.34122 type:complete len:104 (-) Transcript_14085:57-368(-)